MTKMFFKTDNISADKETHQLELSYIASWNANWDSHLFGQGDKPV